MATYRFRVVGLRQWAFEDSSGQVFGPYLGEIDHEVQATKDSEFAHGLAAAVDAATSNMDDSDEFMGEGVYLLEGSDEPPRSQIQSQADGELIWSALWYLKGQRDREVYDHEATLNAGLERIQSGEGSSDEKQKAADELRAKHEATVEKLDKGYAAQMEKTALDVGQARKLVDEAQAAYEAQDHPLGVPELPHMPNVEAQN